MVEKSKPYKYVSIKRCFKKLIYQMTFLHNRLKKIFLKHCHNQIFQQQNELQNWFWADLDYPQFKQDHCFPTENTAAGIFYTCDETIFYDFRTPPSVVLSRLFSIRAYDIHNTVQRLTCRAYTWSHVFLLPEILLLNYYQST